MACGCETYTCIEAWVNPCSTGVELPIEASDDATWNARIEFNGQWKAFSFEVSENEDIVLPALVFNEDYTHELRITTNLGVETCYKARTAISTDVAGFTPDPPANDVWQWGELAVNGNTVSDTLLGGDLSPIIWLNEQPLNWDAQGITHVGDTLDFTAIGGAFGTLIFQYRNL